jgi:hypothetical protein
MNYRMKNRNYSWARIRKSIQSAEKKEPVNYMFVKWAIPKLSDEGIVDAERIMKKKYPNAYEECKEELYERMSIVGMTPEDFLEDKEIKFIVLISGPHKYLFVNPKYTLTETEHEFVLKNCYKNYDLYSFYFVGLQWSNGKIAFKGGKIEIVPDYCSSLRIFRKNMEPTSKFLEGEIQEEELNYNYFI